MTPLTESASKVVLPDNSPGVLLFGSPIRAAIESSPAKAEEAEGSSRGLASLAGSAIAVPF